MSIKNIGIIGSGIMGSGIAQVSAAAGYQIVIQDISKDALEKKLNRRRLRPLYPGFYIQPI
jgi:3-hydroxybutyryl-CoA dehydrogenase